MTIEIKDRWSGKSLYVAKNATDVCEALAEALKSRANLRGANLRGADLTRANLTNARLTGANLTRADLTGADLTGANLTRADLTRANLTNARLTGANLTRARLRGARLRGANLTGASLTGADLTRADLTYANLTGANLTGADLTGARLTYANLTYANLTNARLTYADLTGADLTGANLTYANLTGARLRGADLTGADLTGAIGIDPQHHNDLLLLREQPGKVRAYKLVTAGWTGPTYPCITYKVGESYEVPDANADENVQCGAGINIATLPWCVKNWRAGYRILVVEFTAKDIAAIPLSDGKFRVRRCKVIRELDLVELGLVEGSADGGQGR